MASVSSLDQDMRKLRMDRYTPGAAREVKAWIEETLGEQLAAGDLMDALKDGVALCKLVNLAVSPGVKYKASAMPFVQMENISHFLKACEMPPLSLPSHDRFLTVDLYDGKDPAQVLQCLAAFSRRANIVRPSNFPETIGAKSKGNSMSPQGTGSSTGVYAKSPSYTTNAPRPDITPTTFNPLNKSSYSGRSSPTKTNSLSRGGLATGGPVSSWSSRDDESKTAPAWNIHQYGYMGGASQGNQGVAFGARRQITSQAPSVPSLAEKEKRLKAKMEQERLEMQENERRQALEREDEEIKAREEEERRWAEEERRMREQELEQQQAEARQRREQEARDAATQREARMASDRSRQRTTSDARLNGQFLSQYKAEAANNNHETETAESRRVAELERELAELKRQQASKISTESPSRPGQHQARVDDTPEASPKPNHPTRNTASQPTVPSSHEDDWEASERDYLKKAWKDQQDLAAEQGPPKPPRPEPAAPALPTRPLPDPTTYQHSNSSNRTDRFLATNPAPSPSTPRTSRPADYSTTTEVDLEDQRRAQSQTKTKAGGWASKSLLEREMERERERQREWEEAQKQTADAPRDANQGARPGQSWDVHQYGYMGGDSQNRGGPGLGVGGARRQIIGPRPPP